LIERNRQMADFVVRGGDQRSLEIARLDCLGVFQTISATAIPMIFRRIDNRIMGKVLLNSRYASAYPSNDGSDIADRSSADSDRMAHRSKPPAGVARCSGRAAAFTRSCHGCACQVWALCKYGDFGRGFFRMENSVSESLHPAAPHHLPGFITAPGETDVLMIVVGIILIGSIVAVGNLYLHLHTLPERMAHKSQKLQFEIVAVLGLLALFTHNHLFWVIGLFLAMVDLPDFGTPLRRIAGSVEKMAGVPPEPDPTETPTETADHGAATNSTAAKSEAQGHA
jgi:hypothetical protein